MTYDLAIIGAGMAGASLAAEVGTQARVLLLEAEDMPGYHTTGRSAAFWEECYGGPAIVPLSRASEGFLRDGGYLKTRGALYIGRAQEAPMLDAFEARFADSGARFERLSPGAAHGYVPTLRAEWREAIWQPHCADIDVAALHQSYLKSARAAGAQRPAAHPAQELRGVDRDGAPPERAMHRERNRRRRDNPHHPARGGAQDRR